MIDEAIRFVRDHQPSFKMNAVTKEYDISFYNRRDQLQKGSQEYHDDMTLKYIKAFNDKNPPPQG